MVTHRGALIGAAMSSLMLLSTTAQGAVSAEEAARLQGDLTPLGAERAGNADGTIPAWDGGLQTAPEGIAVTDDLYRPDPFADDEPLYRIPERLTRLFRRLPLAALALWGFFVIRVRRRRALDRQGSIGDDYFRPRRFVFRNYFRGWPLFVGSRLVPRPSRRRHYRSRTRLPAAPS